MKHPLATPLRLLAIAAIAALPLVSVPKVSAANDAGASMTPGSQTITKGGSVTFTINVDPGSNTVSTWEIYVKFPTNIFSGGTVVAAPGSPFTFTPDSSVANGQISIVYSTLSGASAYTYKGALATVTLNSTGAGVAALNFEPKCADINAGSCAIAYSSGDNSANVFKDGVGTGTTITVNNPPASGGTGSTGGSTGSTSGGSTSGGSTSTNKGSATKTGTTTQKTATTTGTTPTTPSGTANTPTTGTKTNTSAETGDSEQANVTLTLLDQDGKPVVGAKVTLSGVTGTTDKNGKVTLKDVSPGTATGKVTYKGETKPITVEVQDGSNQPAQASKLTIKVKKSNAVVPVAVTVGTLAVVAGAAYAIIGPGKGLGSLFNKLPGNGGPKPPIAPGTGAGPTPPTTPPTPPASPTPSSSIGVNQPKPADKPKTTLPKHMDPMAPGTTFTPNQANHI